MNSSKVVEGSLLDALRKDSFLYVYVNTAAGSPTFSVGDHALQLGEGDSKRLLSVFYPMYQFARSSSRVSQNEDIKEKKKLGSTQRSPLSGSS